MSSRSSKLVLDLMEERELTQSALASAAGVSTPYVNHIVKSRQIPSKEWIDAVCCAMSFSDDEKRKLYSAMVRDRLEREGIDPLEIDLTI